MIDNRKVKVNEEVNLIADIASVYHLLSAVNYSYKISKNRKVNGIILINKHYLRNNPIQEGEINFGNVHLKLVRYEEKDELVKESIGSKRVSEYLNLLSVRVPNFGYYNKCKNATNKRVKIVLIEEGIGTYYNPTGFVYHLKTYLKIFYFKLFNNLNKDFLLKRFFNELTINEDNVQSLLTFLNLYSDKVFPAKTDLIRYKDKKIAIFIAGLFVEMGIVSIDEYIILLNKVLDVLKKYDIELLIKPYQSEDLEKYKDLKIDTLPWDLPIEVLFSKLKPVLTIGNMSTAMLNGKILYNIECVDVSDIFGLKNDPDYEIIYNKTFSFFSCFMKRVDSIKEFEELIKGLNL